MKGDFSRDTFNRKNHYRRVLMQQGRVEVDADVNEQVAIEAYVDQTTTLDVIGPSGVPALADGTPSDAFKITLDAQANVGIGMGHMYVDGLLVENDDAAITYLSQPDRPGLTLATDPGLAGDGVYVAYLDVWERLITALDNPLIRETALGGPDHGVRARTVWQVKLAKVGDLNGSLTCATTGGGWIPQPGTGTLAAGTGAPVVDQIPCILPPETGYRRLENQHYRVEIHQGGPVGTATFKWSRENGSVVAGVVGDKTGGALVVGPAFLTTSTGRDESLGYAPDDWVELIDDSAELLGGVGQLLRVKTVDTAALLITTTAGATVGVDPKRHAKLRRWDQAGAGLESGVAIPDSLPIDLEEGVQVSFTAGTYTVGDYWTIPARTRSAADGGHVEWPVDSANVPLSLPPTGIGHSYAKLALIAVSGGAFQLINGEIPDCRPCFQPLTQLKPCQSCASPCTLVVKPGPGWEQPIIALFAADTAVDAEICFPVGDFPIEKTLVIADAGNVKVTGAGFGTRLFSRTDESVIRFSNCISVLVSDLTAFTSVVDPLPGPSAQGPKPFDQRDHINGVFEFIDCDDVSVETLSLTCGRGTLRGASCLTLRATITAANAATGFGTARIRDCRMSVGEMQFGILLVHLRRAVVEDNEIRVTPNIFRRPWAQVLADRRYLAMARGALLANAMIVAPVKAAAPKPPTPARPAPAAATTDKATAVVLPIPPRPVSVPDRRNATVTIAGRSLSFETLPGLQASWQTYFNSTAPKTFATDRDLMAFVVQASTKILTDAEVTKNFSAFNSAVLRIKTQDAPVAARGIAVGGRTIRELKIANNSISGTLQAITVGMSHAETLPPGAPDRAGRVTITGNTINVEVNTLARRSARHAIFVGNVDSLLIEHNRAGLIAPKIGDKTPIEGIRVFGYLGKTMIVRHNYLSAFPVGIRVVPMSAPGVSIDSSPGPYQRELQHGNQWLIADNMFDGAGTPIDAFSCTQWGNWS